MKPGKAAYTGDSPWCSCLKWAWIKGIFGMFLNPHITGYILACFDFVLFSPLPSPPLPPSSSSRSWGPSNEQDPGTTLKEPALVFKCQASPSFLEGQHAQRWVSGCVNSQSQGMRQEGKESENCRSNYRLTHTEYSSQSQHTGRCDQRGECIPHLCGWYPVHELPMCLLLAVHWAFRISAWLPSITIHHPSWPGPGVNECWVMQTFKKECPTQWEVELQDSFLLRDSLLIERAQDVAGAH